MELVPEIASRKTIRRYQSRKIEKDKLDRIIEAGRLAPSAKNRQPWRFIVVEDERLRGLIKNASYNQDHVGQAPVIVAGCTTNIDYKMPNGHLSYPVDIALALGWMTLQAVRESLGTCWITTFDEQEILEILTVPYGMRCVALLLIGYPDENPEPAPRKTKNEISSLNHW